MKRRFFGLAPFPKHHRCCAFHFGILVSRADVARKLKPVAIGVKEINGPEYAVTCRANHINAPPLDMCLGGQQRVEVCNLKRDMLHPGWRVGVFTHFGLVGQFKESDDIAPAAIQEDVHIGIILTGRRHFVLSESGGVFHAKHPALPFRRFLGAPAAIGNVVNAL